MHTKKPTINNRKNMILIISKCAICDSVRRSPIYKLPHHAYINFVSHNSRCRSIICISFFFLVLFISQTYRWCFVLMFMICRYLHDSNINEFPCDCLQFSIKKKKNQTLYIHSSGSMHHTTFRGNLYSQFEMCNIVLYIYAYAYEVDGRLSYCKMRTM